MKKLKPIIAFTAVLLFMQSCGDKTKVDKPCHATWEFHDGNTKDTINKTDCNGLKQGKWMPNKSNQLTVATYYRNDTIIDSQ